MKQPHRRPAGQGSVEFVLIIGLISIAAILLLSQTSFSLSNLFCQVVEGFNMQSKGLCAAVVKEEFASLENWTNVWGNPSLNLSNGKLCMGKDGRLLNKTKPPDDCHITVDKAQLNSGSGYGIMFRMTQSGNNYAGYTFQVDPGLNKRFVFRRYDRNGSELSTPLSAAAPSNNFNWNAPHKVEVVAVGSKFQAYVDGVLVLTASDSTYSSGQAGLRTWDSTDACFDNFTITP